MNPIIEQLMKWNKIFPEHHRCISIRLYDDGSGCLLGFHNEEIFEFYDLAYFFDADPQKVKDAKE